MTQLRLSIPRLVPALFAVLLFLVAPVTTIAQQDTTPPVLLELSFTPTAIDTTNSSQDVTVTARFTDALSGFSDGCVYFSSPSQALNRVGCFGSYNRISGDALDGVYQTTVTFQQFIEAGTWHITYFYANDFIGNQRVYNEQDLINLGFPTTLLNTTDQFPVANAGADQFVEIGLMATLDGSASYDPEAAGPLSYEWRDSSGTVLGTTASINVAAAFGTKTYTLTVTDVVGLIGSDTVDVTGLDTTPPVVTVVKPNGGEKLFVNTPYIIQWNAADLGVISFFDVFYSLNGGGTYLAVPGCGSVDGSLRSCTWALPGTATTTGRIRVVATDASNNVGMDASNANFSIVAGSGSITVTAPNTAVDWGIGARYNITWNHNLGINAYVRIEVSRDGRETWQEIAASVKNTGATAGTYTWQVTGPITPAARIRVSGVDVQVSDISNVDFIISEVYIGVALPAVTSANFGYGTLRTQTWTTNLGPLEKVDLLMSTDSGATCSELLVSNIVASNKTRTYTVPTLGLATAAARMCVRWTSTPALQGLSPANFNVGPPYVKVLSPNLSTDVWTVNSTRTINWASNLGGAENVLVELSLDGGTSYTIVVLASTPSDGTQSIVVPAGWGTPTAKIRITWLKNSGVTDDSSQSFPIN